MPSKVEFVEVVPDARLKKKEAEATEAFRQFFPKAAPLKLYRTSDGRVGFQAQIALLAGERARLESAYAAVMRVLGEKRGRPAGDRKIPAKLRLREPVYKALKAAAARSHTTISGVVEALAEKGHLV